MLECLQCNDDFIPTNKELFCCMECRLKFWRSKSKKGSTDDHLEDLKYTVERSRAEARNLKFHIDRVLNDYSDWEDRVVAIEARLRDIEEDLEIEEKEVDNTKLQPQKLTMNALDELFADTE